MNRPKVLSVSELARLLQKCIQADPLLTNIWVRGELSNFKKHSSGHLYFSLKDGGSAIRAVMFKSHTWTLNFNPSDGMDCLVRGYIAVYPRESSVQLYCEEIIPAGIGLQHLALEELKKRLAEKGFFATERKRMLPYVPQAIGVVTSPTGAAIRDIQQVIERRFPGMPIFLYPTMVQGHKAVTSIVAGLSLLGSHKGVEVIILARGGGSKEDLDVFNDEAIAQAIYSCPKPVISAVGHEIDITIADRVADRRAATPSQAGELAVPVKLALLEELRVIRHRLGKAMLGKVEREKTRVAYMSEAGVLRKPERWLAFFQEDLGKCEVQLSACIERLLQHKTGALEVMAGKIEALSPLKTLARGYCIGKTAHGQVLLAQDQVNIEDDIEIQLHSGRLECKVVGKGTTA